MYTLTLRDDILNCDIAPLDMSKSSRLFANSSLSVRYFIYIIIIAIDNRVKRLMSNDYRLNIPMSILNSCKIYLNVHR